MSRVHLEPARIEAIFSGDPPSEEEAEHLLSCPSCADVHLDPQVARGLSILRADEGHHEGSGTLASLLTTIRRRNVRVRVGMGAALALAIVFVWLGAARAPKSHAEILVEAGTRAEKLASGAHEVVRIEGRALLKVAKLGEGERFVVVAGPDELEVRGTEFTVFSDPSGLRVVAVAEGAVEIRAACCPIRLVSAGDNWTRPVPSAEPPMTPPIAPLEPANGISSADLPDSQRPAPTSSGMPSPGTGPTVGAPGADLLAQGTNAYDAGRFGAAAALLARAAESEPSAPWAKDARTLSGAAQVLAAPVDAIPSLGVSVASFDAAAKRALRSGDGRRAAMASIGAARRSRGESGRARWCALAKDGSLPAGLREEAARGCGR